MALWYHGGTTSRLRHNQHRWDRDRSVASLNAEGPGLYFTTDPDEAAGYGPVVVVAELKRGAEVLKPRRPLFGELLEFYDMAPEDDQERFLLDWGGDSPEETLSRYAHADTALDAFVQLYGDLLHYDADEYVSSMRALGYAAALVPREGADHLIVWYPGALDVLGVLEAEPE